MVGLVVAVLCSLVVTPVFAAKGDTPANDNPNNLYLYEKDANWGIVEDGAWGIYDYSLSRGGKATRVSGIFYGYGLEDGTSYSLIYYPEVAPNPWVEGEYEVAVIGNGVAEDGKVEITGSATIGFPDEQPEIGDYVGQTGDKIWLVLSDDLEDGVMTA